MAEQNKSALVVDDLRSMRRLMKERLTQIGFASVDLAENGKAALKFLENNEYDLIISDFNMPGMGGLNLLEMVRSGKAVDVPFLMMTAYSDKDSVVASLNAGASDFLVKPFSADVLASKVKELTDI